MKTTKYVLTASFLLYAVMIAAFSYLMLNDNHYYACWVKPFVVWAFSLFFTTVGIRFPAIKPLAWRVSVVFFIYGLGDVVMEMGTELTPLGIVFFATGHIFYIVSIVLARDAPTEEDVPVAMEQSTRKIVAIICSATLFALTSFVVTRVYAASKLLVFCCMAEVYAQLFTTIIAIGCLKLRRASSIAITVIGAFLYAASDICIATQRYIGDAWWMPPFVMVTYWGAVLLFALAFFPAFFHAVSKGEAQTEKPKDE